MPVRRTVFAPVAAALLTFALPVIAQDAQSSFLLESRLLENEISRYGEVRQRENQAIQRARDLAQRLDDALADPNASIDTLRRIETELSAAAETAYLRIKESAAHRGRMYERMERLAELAQQVQAAEATLLDDQSDISGLWRVEALDTGIYALFQMKLDGAAVSGTYRTSNGRTGSLRGTFMSGRLELERIDAAVGPVGEMEGDFDSASGELEGTWSNRDVTGGQPSAGRWVAHRVADAGAEF